ncbi:ArsR/SmtB family transcription factor [Nocardioides panaciterrulae]|uniref:DNA-binding transcriptional ArsR family regulator n=1 Tax=Nocardioides panaciterrulae TaxID=661492 RepID=A0A7Y9E7T3_9ACTN|nr:winged helix-turn-helix domain-containing protein [Nocardioides panaciterrulae]NYD42750.1 DNA-binding transcriptional ArsR family regulator [Nocardioides panaciterrulae]
MAIHLSLETQDLLQVRFAPSTLWETTGSLHVLGDRQPTYVHQRFRSRLLRRADRDLLSLLELTTISGWIPDTLTPIPGGTRASAVEELAAVAATPDESVDADLAVLGRHRPRSSWAGMTRVEFRERLAEMLVRYWRAELEQHWERVEAIWASDIAHRQRIQSRHGLETTFHSLGNAITYQSSSLVLGCFPGVSTLDVGGHRVLLVPSVFQGQGLATAPGQPAGISYPARGAGTMWETELAASRELGALIGRTRARILSELGLPRTTTQLARSLELAPATVSAHLGALAASGLARGVRDGRAVRYELTAIGSQLLDASECHEQSA